MGIPLGISLPSTEAGTAQRIKLTKGDADRAASISRPASGPTNTSMSDKEVAHYNRPGIRTRGGDYSVAREARKD